MAQVEIIDEKQLPTGWEFTVQILHDDGQLSSHSLRLAWADYNLWSADGGDEPGKVADAVVAFLLQKVPAKDLPAKIDAAMPRRRFPDADETIPKLIGL